MRARLAAIMAVSVALSSGTPVKAQPLQYFFTNAAGQQQSNFSIPAIGQTITINVFLHDTDAASSWFTGANPQNAGVALNPTQTANLSTYGLRGSQFQITSNAPGVARVNSTSNVTGNSNFNQFNSQPPFNNTFSAVNAAAGTVQIQGTRFETPGGPGIAASVSPNGGHQVFIGSFVFTATGSGITTLTFSDFSTSQVNGLATEPTSAGPPSNGGTFLDANTLSPFTTIPGLFSVTATISVPEPTSLAFGGIGLLGCALVRRFRRKP
jgi:hypothetical protein